MARRKTDRLPLHEAKSIVEAILPREGHEKSLFRHLESEDILSVVPEYQRGGDEWKESVRFAYQRFSDHLITQRLLLRHLDKANPRQSFSKGRTLGKLLKDERACWMNNGMLQAMAIQIPELTGKELPDIAPHLANLRPMREAFVESMLWRDPNSFSKATDSYINGQVLRHRDSSTGFWSAVLNLASSPNHPLNADRLDAILRRLKLAERDAWWSIFLHNQWDTQGRC